MEQQTGTTATLPPPVNSKDQNTWAMLCHLSAFAGFVFPMGGNIIGPLVVWLIKRDDYPLVADQGREAVNFQISLTIYLMISAILVLAIIGIFFLLGLVVFSIIVTIIAMVKASEGVAYRYPLCIRFIK
jgi:uncharacterized protein